MTEEQLNKANSVKWDIQSLKSFLKDYDTKDDKLGLVLEFINEPNRNRWHNGMSEEITDKLTSFNKDISNYKREIADKVVLMLRDLLKERETDFNNL